METVMAKPVLSDPRFFSEEAAFDYVEAQLWPTGPVCPHCQATGDKIGRLERRSKPSKKNPAGVPVVGLRKCYACRQTFTVRMGSIFEDSHFPLHMWLQAIHLLCASKKGIATRQLHRMLGCGLKTAWHLGHRIRFAMDPGYTGPMGGEGKTIEADDMELGRSPKTRRHPLGRKANVKVLSLVERGGPIRSMVIDHRGIGGLF
jgi:transposase-like protein